MLSCSVMSDPLIPRTVAFQAPVHGIFQARILERVDNRSTPGDLPIPRTEPVSLVSPALVGRFFTTSATLLL